MANDKFIYVQVAYALPEQQYIIKLNVPEQSTVLQAVEQSGLLAKFPEIDFDKDYKLGIFSKAVSADSGVREGDRIEIYRPLLADPKEVRKRRAAEAAAKKAQEES